MDCYAKEYCKKYKSEVCNERCDLYYLLESTYKQSNLPKRYRYDITLTPEQIDLPSFVRIRDYQNDVLQHMKAGTNLLIYSKVAGNGKTSWSSKIANFYIRKALTTFSTQETPVLFLNTSAFLDELKESFNTGITPAHKQMAIDCRLLILDDLGAEKPSEWVCERLYDILNTRYSESRPTIFTSNLQPEQIGDRLGARIQSRVCSGIVVEIKGGDRRCQ